MSHVQQSLRRSPCLLRPWVYVVVMASFCAQASMAQEQGPTALGASAVGMLEKTASSTLAVVDFDALFLRQTPYAEIDVTRFRRGQTVLPGRYALSVYVNGQWRQEGSLRFQQGASADEVWLCVDRTLLQSWQLADGLMAKVLGPTMAEYCGPLAARVPGLAYQLGLSDLRLDVTIPQALLAYRPTAYVDAAQWDRGDVAAFVNYQANHYERQADGRRWRDESVGLRAGISAYGWALRHSGYYTKSAQASGEYRSDGVYVQTDVAALRAQLKVGTFYTEGQLQNSFKLKGIQVASDERMLPPQWRGYAPVVRGVARSNAKVTIRQQGQIIYETTVPAGAFAISDLYPLGYAGDLAVTVTEVDGQRQHFTVPFAAVVQLLRPGFARYSVAVGKVVGDVGEGEAVWQGAWQYGLSNWVTLNASWQQHQDYRQGLLGLSINTAMGALGLDHSRSRSAYAEGQVDQGDFWRLNYSKRFGQSQTSLYASAIRYGASGAHQLADFLRQKNQGASAGAADLGRSKLAWQVSMNQDISPRWGSVYVSASRTEMWGGAPSQTSVQMGYAHQYQNLRYHVSVGQSQGGDSGAPRQQVNVSLSMPLSGNRPQQTVRLTQYLSRDRSAETQLGYDGMAGARQQINYGLAVNQAATARLYSGYLGHQGRLGQFGLTASQSKGDRQLGLAAQGALVVHPQGVLLSPSVGESFAIIQAQGAAGAEIKNQPGTYLNAFGQGVVPYLSPYELNHVGIDPQGIDEGVTLRQTEKRLVPRGNGVSMVRFASVQGRSVLFVLAQGQGKVVPMGAEALDQGGNVASFVGQAGRLYLPSAPTQGHFTLQWRTQEGRQQCVVIYALTAKAKAKGMDRLEAKCVWPK